MLGRRNITHFAFALNAERTTTFLASFNAHISLCSILSKLDSYRRIHNALTYAGLSG